MTALMAVTPLTNQPDKDGGWRGTMMRGLVDFHYNYYHYFTYKDKQPWSVTVEQLLQFPADSVGYKLGSFLHQNGFGFIPKFENHDLFHVLLGYGLTVSDEVQMQCCLAGSGRRTLSTWVTIIIGVVFYPEYWPVFRTAYRRGKTLCNFSYWDFESMLEMPLAELQRCIRMPD